MENKMAALVLSDGTILEGRGFGATSKRIGEIVFNTSMQGYQEALTDPSYSGQIITMTYPLIGNYGIFDENLESRKIQAFGFVVRELDEKLGLYEYLEKEGIGGITNIDTRFLTKKIREFGVMGAALVVYKKGENQDFEKILKEVKEYDYSKVDYVGLVSIKEKEEFKSENSIGKKIALIDLGVKSNTIREFNKRGIDVVVVPAYSTTKEIEELAPDGIMISNGPGDPANLTSIHKVIRELADKDYPIFGICLGHQCIAHSFGGTTKKLKFGHRGSNHPINDLIRKRVVITTQNHGYAIDKIPDEFVETHVNLLDNSNEGIKHKEKKIFSVQFHPESCPGPNDTRNLFDEFINLL